ncbi:MAG: molybdopterin-binding protein, partial [Boseongicola sp.]|nr:molybdopterin-binding protein [Boseongicola sp.]
FGDIAVANAEGAILAQAGGDENGRLRKGLVLGPAEIDRLKEFGMERVVAVQLEPDDVVEDKAAERIAKCLIAPGLSAEPVSNGRVNIITQSPGLIRVDETTVHGLNRIDEGLSLATLPDLMKVDRGQLVATVKIIPYALPEAVLRAGEKSCQSSPIALKPFQGGSASLIMTRTPGFKDSLLEKGRSVVAERLSGIGYGLGETKIVKHEANAVADALAASKTDLTLILGASATSDRSDVAPAAVVQAGGRIERFGMPVDPGNLLFLGSIGNNPVVGLPGCARSPALNGVDWVLERLSAGVPITSNDIAAMGVGGLLKEMPGRPQPRRPKS